MVTTNGVANMQFARITWDGSYKLNTIFQHHWELPVIQYSGRGYHHDEVLQNAAFGEWYLLKYLLFTCLKEWELGGRLVIKEIVRLRNGLCLECGLIMHGLLDFLLRAGITWIGISDIVYLAVFILLQFGLRFRFRASFRTSIFSLFRFFHFF